MLKFLLDEHISPDVANGQVVELAADMRETGRFLYAPVLVKLIEAGVSVGLQNVRRSHHEALKVVSMGSQSGSRKK